MLIKTNNIKSFKLQQIQPVLDILPVKVVLAGGALKSLFDHKPISDFDLFILSDDLIDLLIKKVELEGFLKNEGFREVFRCPQNELTTFKRGHLKLQVINAGHQIYSSPEDVIDKFDFNLCRMAYFNDTLYFYTEAVRDLVSRRLSLNELFYPSSTIHRLGKYRKQGYSTGQVSRQISEKFFDNVRRGVMMWLEVVYVD